MATKPVDLRRATANVEGKIMQDVILIEDDVQRYDDDSFDPSTGTYSRPTNDQTFVYRGPGAVVPANQEAVTRGDDGAIYQAPDRAYDGLLPARVRNARPNHVLTVVRSVRDPEMTGRRFRVVDDIVTSLPVLRRVRLQELREGSQRPY